MKCLHRTLVAVTLMATSVALAGEREAIEATIAGDRALAAKDPTTAETKFREAVEADATYLPAHQGLGEALFASGRKADALVPLRFVDRNAPTGDALTADLRRRVVAARRRLDEIDPEGRALAALFRAHADAVTALGERQRDADPDLADRAAGIALGLVPDHERAAALRAQLASKGLRREALFDGQQIADWDGAKSAWWRVTDGVIVGDAKGIATFVRNQTTVEGNFDLLVEARLVQAYGSNPYFAVMGAWAAEFDNSRFGVLVDALQWVEYRSEQDLARVYRSPVAKLPKPLDPKTWAVYELRYREGKIEAWLNGKKLAETKRHEARTGGFVGLLAQDCRVEFRRVDVIRR